MTMQGRGVSSVRSPVRNIRDFKPDLDHEKFVSAVISSFTAEFGVEEKYVVVDEAMMLKNSYIASEMEELLVRLPPMDEAFEEKLTVLNRRGNGSTVRLLTSSIY